MTPTPAPPADRLHLLRQPRPRHSTVILHSSPFPLFSSRGCIRMSRYVLKIMNLLICTRSSDELEYIRNQHQRLLHLSLKNISPTLSSSVVGRVAVQPPHSTSPSRPSPLRALDLCRGVLPHSASPPWPSLAARPILRRVALTC
jgi:hypothetical protein